MESAKDIDTFRELEELVGKRPPSWHLKSIEVLDEHCRAFLPHSTFAILGVQGDDGRLWDVPLGREAGLFEVLGADRLRLRIDPTDVPSASPLAGPTRAEGIPAALVAMIPGYRETLRINGRLIGDELVTEEVFLHCAKCMIRSKMWELDRPTSTGAEVPAGDLHHPEIADFLASASFVTMTSADTQHNLDVSPKGDPPGFVRVLDAATVAIPDRPGNRRTDSFHNLVQNPRIALTGIVPGDDRVLRLQGQARLSGDEDLRAGSEVRGNRPAAMLVVSVDHAELVVAQALAGHHLWDRSRHADTGLLPRASKVWTDHVKMNTDPGLAARLARAAMREQPLRAGLKHDYRNNLY